MRPARGVKETYKRSKRDLQVSKGDQLDIQKNTNVYQHEFVGLKRPTSEQKRPTRHTNSC